MRDTMSTACRPDRKRVRASAWAFALSCLMGGALAGCGDDQFIKDDLDNDNWTVENGDCDDRNHAVNPSAAEYCNGVDDDCDGEVDENSIRFTYYPDEDADGYGDAALPQYFCLEQEGLPSVAGDCDDRDPLTHPGVVETCDGQDNDCNGIIDDLPGGAYFQDADLDGFGSNTVVSCTPKDGYIQVRGDCDDTQAEIHPGAADAYDDGVDQDCGGSTNPEPHVGLGSASSPSIQSALNAAERDVTIWVGPGRYQEASISFGGKPVRLVSTHLANRTTLDADGAGSVVVFRDQEQASSILDGFEVTGAPESAEGAIEISGASPSLRNLSILHNFTTGVKIDRASVLLAGLNIEGNTAYEGGGVMATDSRVTVVSSSLSRNRSLWVGGGISAYDSTLMIQGSSFDGNVGDDGGGIMASSSTLVVEDSDFSHNLVTYQGGGIYASSCDLEVRNTQFSKNGSFIYGGGLTADYCTLSLSRSSFVENYGYYAGGLELWDSEARVSNVLVSGNLGVIAGGGASILRGTVRIEQSTFVGNVATLDGGAIYAWQSEEGQRLEIDSTILASNAAAALYLVANDGVAFNLILANSLISNPHGILSNINLPQDTNVFGDPMFVDFSPNRNPYDDDLHLRPGSPAFDAGNPYRADADGSRADIGLYGGPDGDHSYYQDGDEDTLYDGWELKYGLDTQTVSAGADPDGDGLANLSELKEGGNPMDPDTDDDGVADGLEASAQSDLADWFSRPGGGLATGRVPQDFPTIQAGVDAVRRDGVILADVGTFSETLDIALKQVKIRGRGLDKTILMGPQEGSVVVAVGATLSMEDITVSGGFFSKDSEEEFSNGAGLSLSYVDGTFRRVALRENWAVNGGGAALWHSSASFSECEFTENRSQACGAGIAGYYSSFVVTGSQLTDNIANDLGGAIYHYSGDLTVDGTEMLRNEAYNGGAVAGREGTFDGKDLELVGNLAGGSGGALWHHNETVNLEHSLLSANRAGYYGGGAELLTTVATLKNVQLDDCVAPQEGGGLDLSSSSLTGRNLSMRRNKSAAGGAIYAYDSLLHLSNFLAAENETTAQGGALCLSATYGDVAACQITGNRSPSGYAAVYLLGSSPGITGLVLANSSAIGMLLDTGSAPAIVNSILAYNPEGNLMFVPDIRTPLVPVTFSVFYNPSGLPNTDLSLTDPSTRKIEPGFLRYGEDMHPTDFHLALDSALIDRGAPGPTDEDGSGTDIGLYGGPLGDEWDRDQDEVPDYFWSGELEDVPEGINAGGYDENDFDATIQ